MRVHRRWTPAAAILLVVLLLVPVGAAMAALQEKPVLDDINDNLAVLHGLKKQIADIEQNLEIVRACHGLTQRQYEAQKKLYETEQKFGDKDRALMFKARLDRLKKQMTSIEEFDFEKMYAKRIKALQKEIALVKLDLEARIIEFETLFGKKPHVDMSFEKELERRKGTRQDLEHYLKLDR